MRKIILLAILFLSACVDEPLSYSRMPDIVKNIDPIMKNITPDYDISVLENHLDPIAFKKERNREHYIMMLKKASVLGKLNKCSEMTAGHDIDDERITIIYGQCDFENGRGEINIKSVTENEKTYTYYFVIKPLET